MGIHLIQFLDQPSREDPEEEDELLTFFQKNLKWILIGTFILAFASSAFTSHVSANPVNSSFPVGFTSSNQDPRVFLLNKSFDVGIDDSIAGGSSADLSLNPNDLRQGNYAFTGEQIKEKVLVRDTNGASDIVSTILTVNGTDTVVCDELTVTTADDEPTIPGKQVGGAGTLSDGEAVDFSQIPAVGSAEAGFDDRFDKVFRCILTVLSSYGGENIVRIKATDGSGSVTNEGITQNWIFNPAIVLDISTNNGLPKILFEQGVPGQTVYSINKLIITNMADNGVDLFLWISADDLTDPIGPAICPVSNVLEVDEDPTVVKPLEGMDYRGQRGTTVGDWEDIPNPDPGDGCSLTGTCKGANGIVEPGVPSSNRINKNQHAEVQFRLTIPIPCIGDFTDGDIHIVAMAV